MLTLHGIPNCDTVKSARAWLAECGVAYQWHDFAREGTAGLPLAAWLEALTPEKMVNRRGTTWRALGAGEQAAFHDRSALLVLLTARPSLIKPPLLLWPDGTVTVGFDSSAWAQHLGLAPHPPALPPQGLRG